MNARTRTKRWIAVTAMVAFAGFAVWDLVRDFVTNDPVGYFSERPSRLLLVGAIALVGGVIAFLFDRLTATGKRVVTLVALGLLATVLAGFAIVLTVNVVGLATQIERSGVAGEEFWDQTLWSFLYPVAVGLAGSGLCWFWFFRTLKSH